MADVTANVLPTAGKCSPGGSYSYGDFLIIRVREGHCFRADSLIYGNNDC
jgi:hypothetical protein